MDESEKLTALKKAYAEIILNTAKEAAARIMVSERKSLHYQRELLTAKDCALQMLVRLKNMMDSTVSEAEKTSLSQRKKIEELEAQLEEAEDIVKDLREELQHVQDRLEKVQNNKQQAANQQILVGINACRRDITPEDGLNTTGSMSPFSCPEPDPVQAYEIHSTLRERAPEDELNTTESISPLPCSKPEMVSTNDMHSTLNGSDFRMDGGYLRHSDFASVRSKEPELYRNGCTQRIRAFDRNAFDENLSFSGKNDIKSGIINKGDEEAKELQLTQSQIYENTSEDVKKVGITMVSLMNCSDNIGACVLKPCRRKRKREVKYNKSKAPSVIHLPDMPKADLCHSDGDDALELADVTTSLGEEAMETDEAFDENVSFSAKDDIIKGGDEEAKELQLTQSHLCDNTSEDGQKVDIITVSQMDCSNNIEARVLKPCHGKRNREVKYNKGKAPSIIHLPDMPNRSDGDDASETADMMKSLGEHAMESDEAFVKPCNALIMIEDKKEDLDKANLICHDSLSLDSSYGLACKTDVEIVEELLAIPNKKEFDMDDEMQIELSPSSNKLLKYTFRRKRKKEHRNSPKRSSSLDECMLDKEIRESQSTPLGSQKSSSMPESPRENRHLAHVARQLLCFSETKWAE